MRNLTTMPASKTIPFGFYSLLRNWRFWAAVAAITAIAVAAFSWNWLIAVSAAPILLSLLPCAIMCTLGLCFMKMSGANCSAAHREPTDQRSQTQAVEN
jgi:hypothetical protein